MDRFVITTRNDDGNAFGAEPGPTRYLRVPAGQAPSPQHAVAKDKAKDWFKGLRKAATWGRDAREPKRPRGDLVVFVHGYNTTQAEAIARHDQLAASLAAAGFKGAVLTFDWPSLGMAINYLEDRHDAKAVAMQLVSDGIAVLAKEQAPDCAINVHVVAHSMGALVVREAFSDADDTRLAHSGWAVSQLVLIAADISAGSLAEGDARSESLYRHCARLTNYANQRDSALKLSNRKRLGVAPRAGRVGLPSSVPHLAVNVDCTAHFDQHHGHTALAGDEAAVSHSWHFGDPVFAADLCEVLKGDLDRSVIPTRQEVGGRLVLRAPA